MSRRRFRHYAEWEDYRHGQYALVYGPQAQGASDATDLLINPDALYAAMSAVCREWVAATEHNLTDMEQNRRAWLGQAACTFALGVPAFVTKRAWNEQLTDDVRDQANAIADQVITEWEESDSPEQRLW